MRLMIARPEIARSATFRSEAMQGLLNLMDEGEKLCAVKKIIADTFVDHSKGLR
jgi:hypothetical protein